MPDPEFDEMVASLTRGDEPRAATMAALSDLDRAALAVLEAAWPEIPTASREAIMSEAVLLAASEVGYDFERLMLVAGRDSDAVVRRLAAAGLSEATSRSAGHLLAQLLLEDADPSVRAAAAAALTGFVVSWAGRRGFEEALRRILEALRAAASEDVSADVRARSLVAAAGAAEPWIEPLLEDAYYSDDHILRLASLEAMGQTSDDHWLEYLLEQLSSDDAEIRTEAVTACGELGSEEAVEPLSALAGDDDPEVAAASLSALARIGGPLVLEVLNDLKADPPPALDLDLLDAAIEETRESLEAYGPGGDR